MHRRTLHQKQRSCSLSCPAAGSIRSPTDSSWRRNGAPPDTALYNRDCSHAGCVGCCGRRGLRRASFDDIRRPAAADILESCRPFDLDGIAKVGTRGCSTGRSLVSLCTGSSLFRGWRTRQTAVVNALGAPERAGEPGVHRAPSLLFQELSSERCGELSPESPHVRWRPQHQLLPRRDNVMSISDRNTGAVVGGEPRRNTARLPPQAR